MQIGDLIKLKHATNFIGVIIKLLPSTRGHGKVIHLLRQGHVYKTYEVDVEVINGNKLKA